MIYSKDPECPVVTVLAWWGYFLTVGTSVQESGDPKPTGRNKFKKKTDIYVIF